MTLFFFGILSLFSMSQGEFVSSFAFWVEGYLLQTCQTTYVNEYKASSHRKTYRRAYAGAYANSLLCDLKKLLSLVIIPAFSI